MVDMEHQPLHSIGVFAASQEDADRQVEAVQRCAATLLKRHPFLSLDALDRLVIGHDYLDAMHVYLADGRAHLSERYIEKAMYSLAHVLPTQAGIAVIVHPDVLLALQSTEPVQQVKGQRILMHELCHVHDLGLQRLWLMQHTQGNTDVCRTFRACFPLWSEYFANRYSYAEGSDQSDEWMRLDNLLQPFEQLEPGFAVGQTVQRFGYVLGGLAGQGVDLQDVRPDLVPRLHASGLWDAWREAQAMTAWLTETGACWINAQGVISLQGTVEQIREVCWQRCKG